MKKEFITTDDDLVSNSHLFCATEAVAAGRWRDAIKNPEVSSRVQPSSMKLIVCQNGMLRYNYTKLGILILLNVYCI